MLYDEYAYLAQQYKATYGPRTLIAYEVGKFFEWYNCDQNLGCDVHGICELLNVQSTRKSKAIPEVSRTNPLLGGVPVCAFPKYIPVLLDEDYTIVIVRQTTLPPKEIERKVTEIISRGTYLGIMRDVGSGESTSSNACPSSSSSTSFADVAEIQDAAQVPPAVCMCLFLDWHVEGLAKDRQVMHAGCAISDVTTGACECHEINSNGKDLNYALDEIFRHVQESMPSEVVLIGYKPPGFDTRAFLRHITVDDSCIRYRLIDKHTPPAVYTKGHDKKQQQSAPHRSRQSRNTANTNGDGDGNAFSKFAFSRGRINDRNEVNDTTITSNANLNVNVNTSSEVTDVEQATQEKRRKEVLTLTSVKHQEHVLRSVYPDTGFLSAIEALDLEFRPHACTAFVGLLQFIREHNEFILRGMRRPVVMTGNVSSSANTNASCTSAQEARPEARRLLLSYNAAQQLDIVEGNQRPASALTLTKKTGNKPSERYPTSLIGLLDSCRTAVGRRFMRQQLLEPLVDANAIRERLDTVEFRMSDQVALDEERARLSEIRDLERLFRRIALKYASPLDFAALDASLNALSKANERYAVYRPAACNFDDINRLKACYQTTLDVENLSNDERYSSSSTVTGHFSRNVFRPGAFPELDEAQADIYGARGRMAALVDRFNSIVTVSAKSPPAFRLEVSQSTVTANVQNENTSTMIVPSYMIVATPKRCETLLKHFADNRHSNCDIECPATHEKHVLNTDIFEVRSLTSTTSHIIHPRIQEWCEALRAADAKLRSSSRALFSQLMERVFRENEDGMIRIIDMLAHTDFFCACASNALRYRHRRPVIRDTSTSPSSSSWLRAKGLRHPIVEIVNQNTPHVPNDISLGCEVHAQSTRPPHTHTDAHAVVAGELGEQPAEGVGCQRQEDRRHDKDVDHTDAHGGPCGMLLYGMNAAGKSCLMKAVAIAVVMAQAGMCVSAEELELCPFDKVFTRIQSYDDISRGQSTFMVEMSELRNILKRCDSHSLAIGDEVCSGTESVSALAIVGSALKYLLDRNVPFLFATHLHELATLLFSDREGCGVRPTDLRVCHLRVTYDPLAKRLVYDRKLCEGQGATVYGLEVCKALDMDAEFLDSAHALRRTILDGDGGAPPDAWHARPSRYNARVLMDACGVCKRRAATETHHIRPQKEADQDGYIGSFHKNSAFNLVPLCEKCHDAVHRGEVHIEGYLQTSSGPELRFSFSR